MCKGQNVVLCTFVVAGEHERKAQVCILKVCFSTKGAFTVVSDKSAAGTRVEGSQAAAEE